MNSKKDIVFAHLHKHQVIAKANVISDLWWKSSLCTYHKLREKWTILVIIRNIPKKELILSQSSLLPIVLRLKVTVRPEFSKGREG